jgi:tetratricopeptide (TPR) repeat protein
MNATSRYATAHLSEIDARGNWIPLRRHFGIEAFGVNAWTGAEAGAEVIGEHDEASLGHEELYVVTTGRARFTVDGETVDAPAGTVVFVRDPAVKRAAHAEEPGTTILTVGAKPGEAFTPSAWEENADIIPLFEAGEYKQARRRLIAALEGRPDAGGLLYNLACAESRLGEKDAALEHLARAVELEARFAEFAQSDPDLEAIRGESGFPDKPAEPVSLTEQDERPRS